MGQKVDYGAWWSYIYERLDGVDQSEQMQDTPRADPASTIKLGTFLERRDWNRFPGAYFDPEVGILRRSAAGGRRRRRFTLPASAWNR